MTEKKPKGWYGQRVAEMDEEFKELLAEVEALKQLFESDKELRALAEHPMLANYASFYERFRRTELTLENIVNKVNYFEQRIQGVEAAIRSLTAPRGRGA